jgi:hypothetical protein
MLEGSNGLLEVVTGKISAYLDLFSKCGEIAE